MDTKFVNVLRNLKLFWGDNLVSGGNVVGKTEENSLHPSCLPSPFLAPPTFSGSVFHPYLLLYCLPFSSLLLSPFSLPSSPFPPFFSSISIALSPLLPVSELGSQYKFQYALKVEILLPQPPDANQDN